VQWASSLRTAVLLEAKWEVVAVLQPTPIGRLMVVAIWQPCNSLVAFCNELRRRATTWGLGAVGAPVSAESAYHAHFYLLCSAILLFPAISGASHPHVCSICV